MSIRLISYPEHEIEDIQALLHNSFADLGSLLNRLDDQQHITEMAQIVFRNLKTIEGKLFD